MNRRLFALGASSSCVLLVGSSVLATAGAGSANEPSWFAHDELYAVDANATDAWAVGRADLAQKSLTQPLAERWTGSGWERTTPVAAGGHGAFSGVTVIAADDVWAVGGYSQGHQGHALVEHWDGDAWSLVPTPEPEPNWDSHYFDRVSASGPDDVWVVGSMSDRDLDTYRPLVEHWDGTTWRVVRDAGLRFIDDETQAGPDDVWLVSHYPKDRTAHWDGTTWTTGHLGHHLGRRFFSYAASAAATDDAWVVGSVDGPAALHWDGTSWTKSPLPSLDGYQALTDVSAASATDAWAVARPGTGSSGVFLRWDGESWTVVDPGISVHASILDVDAVSDSDAWAIAWFTQQSSYLLHWDGTNWSRV